MKEGVPKNPKEIITITLTDKTRGKKLNLENPVILLGKTLVDGNHKLRFANKDSSYTPDILEINSVEDIIQNKSKLEKITNNQWVTKLLEIPDLVLKIENERSSVFKKLMYEEYGDEYDGWNDSSFITDELLNNKYREEKFKSLMLEAKNNAGNYGKISVEK